MTHQLDRDATRAARRAELHEAGYRAGSTEGSSFIAPTFVAWIAFCAVRAFTGGLALGLWFFVFVLVGTPASVVLGRLVYQLLVRNAIGNPEAGLPLPVRVLFGFLAPLVLVLTVYELAYRSLATWGEPGIVPIGLLALLTLTLTLVLAIATGIGRVVGRVLPRTLTLARIGVVGHSLSRLARAVAFTYVGLLVFVLMLGPLPVEAAETLSNIIGWSTIGLAFVEGLGRPSAEQFSRVARPR